MQITNSLNLIHRKMRMAVTSRSDGKSLNKKGFGLLYVFKILRVAVSWLAFYLADKLFTDYYMKNMDAATNPKAVDLRWYVVQPRLGVCSSLKHARLMMYTM